MGNLDLVCVDCDRDFYIKEEDQEFYKNLGFDLPIRCWYCRKKRKAAKRDKAKSAVYKLK